MARTNNQGKRRTIQEATGAETGGEAGAGVSGAAADGCRR